MRDKLTISIDNELISDIENTRNMKTQHMKSKMDKSHFVEMLLIIGLTKYKEKQRFFDSLNLTNVDLSKINF